MDNVVEHATDSALDSLPIIIGAQNWEDLHEIFLPQFPDFPTTISPHNSPDVTLLSTATTGNLYDSIKIKWLSNGASLTLINQHLELTDQRAPEELELLRTISSNLPHPVWATKQTGSIIWYNDAYEALSFRVSNCPISSSRPLFASPAVTPVDEGGRSKIEFPDGSPAEWFSISSKTHETGIIRCASPLTELIKAEEAQRDFVQTLAKTFAHLSIGLAIFNRDRQLALFNPALVDLTDLSASFLSPRPTIDSFFDALRENRRMPEPKNYKTWRQRMADMISDAETGRFEETWALETGQTYNVKGRPHPDGAIAFLFEDISAEVSLTRNFRAELELGQSIADTFEDAIAVFSQSGALTFSNKAYDLLWSFQFDTSFADVTINDAIQMWKEKSSPNPLWKELHDYVMALGEREQWEMPVQIKGRRPMNCRIVPIASGSTAIRFSRQPAMAVGKTPSKNAQT